MDTIHCKIITINHNTISYYVAVGISDSLLKKKNIYDINSYKFDYQKPDFNTSKIPVPINVTPNTETNNTVYNSNEILNNRMYDAGVELKKTAKQFYWGLAISLVGSAITSIGYANAVNNNKNFTGYIVAGSIVGGIGMVVNLTAFIHLFKAGNNLQRTRY